MIDLGNEPPLSVDGTEAAVIDRRRVSVQWFSGTILTGLCGAALIGGAVFASLDGEMTFAKLPERVQGVVLNGSGDEKIPFTYLSDPKRAMVGVVLDQRDDGVFIAAVTPGGPAEKAGIRAGDKLVSVGGKAIAQPADGKARTPGEALFADGSVVQARDLIGRLEPGQKVDLVVERDGKRQSLQVAAERRESWDWPMLAGSMPALAPLAEIAPMTVTVPNVRVIVERGEGDGGVHTEVIDREIAGNIDREMRRVMVMRGGALFDLKLSPVNPDLGRYFGTDSGVLVLDKGSDTLKELRTGDVITSIAGRRVESTTDAMRALADHEAGSTVNVEVMRDRKRTVLVVLVTPRVMG